jgi:NTE family protein
MKRREFLAGAAALAAFGGAHAARQHKAALVLGGGGCRGYGHIGVLRVLERERLRPGLIVGSSSGALVGALYAAGMGADEIERYGERMSPNLLRDWVFPKLGMFGGDRIRRFVVARVGEKRIEDLPTRFAAVATDLRSGAMRVFQRGDLGRAVQASASIPGLLEPVRIDGRPYVDGNLSAPVPVQAARALGTPRVVAVDVSFPPEQADLGDPFDALYQGFSILTRRLALDERARADLVLEPRLPAHDDMSRATLKFLVAAGERAAQEALPALRRLFA